MARIIYTKEQIDFVREIAPGKWNQDITDLFNEKFGTTVTVKKMVSLKKNHGITSGMRGKGSRVPANKIFTDDISTFIRENYVGLLNTELTDMLNKKFGTTFIVDQIKAFKARNKLDSGIRTYFARGQKSFNKGLKQTDYMSKESIEKTKATRFKKGQKPANYRPVGSERLDKKDGYIFIKVSDKGKYQERWRLKHIVVWEKENGPLPNGHALVFLDRDRTNCSLDNLRLVTRADLARLNQNDLFTKEPELNEVAINIAKVLSKIGDIEKEK